MRFYELTYKNQDIDYGKLYRALENIGDFIIDKNAILFYCDRLNRRTFKGLEIEIKPINAEKYRSDNVGVQEWLISNFRRFRVEKLLKEAEIEKQEELKKLYDVIKSASDIIDRKEDISAEGEEQHNV